MTLSVAVAAGLTWQTTPQYASSARLFVATSDSDASEAYQGGLFATQRVASYADLVPKSRQLAEQVAEALGDSEDLGQIRSQVRAVVVPDTVNLEITARDADPVRARDIAQAYAEALSDLVTALETPDGQTNALIRAQIVDNAEVPRTPVEPRPLLNLGLGLTIGAALGLGISLLRELLDTSVNTAEDIAKITSAPVLGYVTVDNGAAKQPPGTSLVGNSHWAEAFRVLRTNMQYVEVDSDQKVFVITSSVPAEGKSTVAVNLAVTLALTHQRVALVECDLRRPMIARRLGIDEAIGTTNVLIGKVSVREAMQTVGDSMLQVLACGPIPPNPSELLQSKAMETMLAELRSEFDVVLLDAPPLLPVTDAALLAAQSDGAMLIVSHGRTTRDQLTHAIERLDAVDAKTAGMVVNMVPARRGGSYSYSYSYSYASSPAVEPDVSANTLHSLEPGEEEQESGTRVPSARR